MPLDPGSTLTTAYNFGNLSGSNTFTRNDSVGSSDLDDYYRFSLSTLSSFDITVSGLSADANLQLLSSTGDVVVSSTNSGATAELISRLLVPDVYYVRVFAAGDTSTGYILGVQGAGETTDPGDTLASALDLGTIASRNRSWADFVGGTDSDYFQFTLAEARTLTAELTGLSANANLQLLDSVGSVLGSSANEGLAAESISRELIAGTYYLQVTADNADTSYSLSVSDIPDLAGNTLATARAITVDTTVATFTDYIGLGDTNDYYSFSLAAASNFTVNINDLTADIDLTLLDAAGATIASSTTAGTATEFINRQISAGTYYIRVFPFSSSTTYTLSVVAAPLVPDFAGNTLQTARQVAVNLAPGSFNDFIGTADTDDYYRFTLAQAGNFNLVLTGTTADADLELLSSAATLLNKSTRTGVVDEAINQTLDPGTYYARVLAFNGDTTYTLRLSVTPPSIAASPSNLLPIEFDLGTVAETPVSATNAVNAADTADVYRFNFGGGSLNATLTNLTEDADIRLIQDVNSDGIVNDGEELARSQRGGTFDEVISLASIAAGAYFVQVYQYTGSTSYTLNLSTAAPTTPTDRAGNTLATARDIGAVSAQQTFNDFVGTSDRDDYYRFTVDGTSRFNLSLTGLSADADVQLLNGAGELITRSEASGTNPESIVRALTSGTYYLRVYQYSGNTNYNLSVSASAVTLPVGFDLNYGYGLVNVASAVAQAIGQAPFADVPNLGGNNWDLDAINAPEVWARGYTGQGVVVAVVDSGVDYTHPDLDANIWTNTRDIAGNGIDDDGNGYVDDVRGWDFVDSDNTPLDQSRHGTHVAGSIAAENNDVGTTGVAYNAQIMPVRVLGADGSGSNSAVAAGIRYAADNGADIINLSLGGGDSEEIRSAVRYAAQRGALVVMAAGNEYEGQPGFPASLADQVGIAVGAVNVNNRLADFSNRAGLSPLNYVVAPGVNIYSTTPNNTYDYFDGTSMATPHVAGAAALLLSANPDLTPTQLISLLTGTATSSGITV